MYCTAAVHHIFFMALGMQAERLKDPCLEDKDCGVVVEPCLECTQPWHPFPARRGRTSGVQGHPSFSE